MIEKPPVLESIIAELHNFPGIQRKKGIHSVIKKLETVYNFGNTVYPIGDDAAVIRDGSGYLLLAAEEIQRSLLSLDPQWAGFCSVLANVNDIYAMGGTPLAMVNAVSFKDAHQGEEVLEGIREACEKYRVPMVGGHFSPESEILTLTVAILGKAKEVLTSFDAQEGDDVIIALDLQGNRYKNFLHWDCITYKTSEEVLDKLSVLPLIAENLLAHTAKDVSNAGIIGTLCMLLETSQKGGEIFLEEIPVPEGLDFIEWLKMYPSYGFILSAPRENTREIMKLFSCRGYSARTIGRVTKEKKVILHYQGEARMLFDLGEHPLLGQ